MRFITAALLASVVFTTPVSAAILTFSFTSAVDASGNFSTIIDEDVPPIRFEGGAFFDLILTTRGFDFDTGGMRDFVDQYRFFANALDGGGFDLADPSTPDAPFIQFTGPVVFGGPTSTPRFRRGTFELTANFPGQTTQVDFGTLTIAEQGAAAVPEPATWAMMIGGFGLVGGAMRCRRVSSAITYA